jgi:hypothetical protein
MARWYDVTFRSGGATVTVRASGNTRGSAERCAYSKMKDHPGVRDRTKWYIVATEFVPVTCRDPDCRLDQHHSGECDPYPRGEP